MKTSRRTFLMHSVAGAGLLARSAYAASPNSKLNIACVGAGGLGGHFLKDRALAAHNFVAFADVDDRQGAENYTRHPHAVRYKDYRVMLDKHDKEIDAVIISTPDVSHYHIAKAAIERGKHVFCQKPLTHTLWECRQLRDLARANPHIATQMGNQGHVLNALRTGVEWIQAGVIGDVTKVHRWSNRRGNGATEYPKKEPVPPELDWNLWLGPHKFREYSSKYLPKIWRWWWDFGNGALGDIGCHTMDMPFWALKLGVPAKVSAEQSSVSEIGTPKWSIITYKFPERDGMPPVDLVWHDGGKLPPKPKELGKDRELPKEGGAIFYGTKGVIYAPGMRPQSVRVIPETKMKEIASSKALPDPWIPRIKGGIFQDWLNAIENGTQPSSSFDNYATALTEMVLLGNLTLQTGKPIEWDSKNLVAKGIPEAARFIKLEARSNW
ncbi:MAG: Gfo/Idh/MocA family oxidoreductase [Candidatus Hydrogenedentes bacterium]|nr:Gfo/Idh/MocA family oxidoreductase [Candidatus Hydrogenedentota bacterium]